MAQILRKENGPGGTGRSEIGLAAMVDAEQCVCDWAMPKGQMGEPRRLHLPEEIKQTGQGILAMGADGELRRQLGEVFPSIARQDNASGEVRACSQRGDVGEPQNDEEGNPVFSSHAGNAGAERPLGPESRKSFSRLMDEECRKAEERGRIEGFEAGQAMAQQALERRLGSDRQTLETRIASLTDGFATERETYFHRSEREVASLALAIAARILRREAQMDPLLLTGAVRAALGQLSGSTVVRLCVPTMDETLWRESLTAIPGMRQQPQVVGDAEMGRGECRLESDLGTADLGLWTQVKEIERGFFDGIDDGTPPDENRARDIAEKREDTDSRRSGHAGRDVEPGSGEER